MKKKSVKQNNGSALLIAIIIMMVVMMLSLALLLVSYSLVATTSRQNQTEQCREAAQSLSLAMQKEIVDPGFDMSKRPVETDELKAPLWFYLRYNVWQPQNWPYINEDDNSEEAQKSAYRYFKLKDKPEGIDEITILMYWSPEDVYVKDNTSLYVQVTCRKGKQKSVITTTYSLTVEPYTDADTQTGSDTGIGTSNRSDYNPAGNTINRDEKWTWSDNDDRE